MLGVQGQRFLSSFGSPASSKFSLGNSTFSSCLSVHTSRTVPFKVNLTRVPSVLWHGTIDVNYKDCQAAKLILCSFQSPPCSSEWWEQQRNLKLGCLLSPKNCFFRPLQKHLIEIDWYHRTTHMNPGTRHNIEILHPDLILALFACFKSLELISLNSLNHSRYIVDTKWI